jgi:hypothetical protein
MTLHDLSDGEDVTYAPQKRLRLPERDTKVSYLDKHNIQYVLRPLKAEIFTRLVSLEDATNTYSQHLTLWPLPPHKQVK